MSDPEVALTGGCEWVVEAHGCDPSLLRDVAGLQTLFDQIVKDLGLHPVGEPSWHRFDGPGGVTGMSLLSESHLTCHTFPEFGSMCLNLFCCRPRNEWPFESKLMMLLRARFVSVRRIERPYQS
ncbi:MAG TPA: S-adenosylmethionine decarboxylase [Bryobacteraceae bacterium]|nr:S-adenosylmethionine decarboxylase [Bryobacteraceae bacterium]